MTRRSASGFHRPGRHCSQPSAKHSEASGESHEARAASYKEQLERGGFSCTRMLASNESVCFLAWPLSQAAIGIAYDCLVGALPSTHYAMPLFLMPHVAKLRLSIPHKLSNPSASRGGGGGGGGGREGRLRPGSSSGRATGKEEGKPVVCASYRPLPGLENRKQKVTK